MSWRIIGASVPGTLHLRKQLSCQDAFFFKRMSQNQAIVAIADGAGFAERSGEGAQIAARQAVLSMSRYVQKQAAPGTGDLKALMNQVFAETRERLLQVAATANEKPEVFSTTLTVAYAFEEGLVVGQLGDGLVIAEALSGSLFLAAQPQRGEYANQSIFITKNDALDYVKVEIFDEPVRAVVLITDGLLRLAVGLPGYRPFEPFFRPLIEFASEWEEDDAAHIQLNDFLASPRVCDRTDDDKTIVLAVRNRPRKLKKTTLKTTRVNKPEVN